jgi:hypothetical protein
MLGTYPYLLWSLALLAGLAAGLRLRPQHRTTALVGGMYGAPYAVASLLFVPEYWQPVRLWGLAVGVEDLIFSFANGGIVWLIATWTVRSPVSFELEARRSFVRYAACSTSGFLVAFAGWQAGLAVMTAFYLSMIVLGGALLLLRPRLWALSVRGGVGFGLLYSGVTLLVFAVYPDLAGQFSTANLSGVTVGTVPIEELLWAVGYGTVFPMILGYSFEATAARDPSTRSTGQGS